MKIGFLVNNLNMSQLNYYMIRNINYYVSANTDCDFTIFYDNLTRICVTPLCGCMQMSEAFSYNGSLIATSLPTAHRLIDLCGPKKKFFYIWDLEWLRISGRLFQPLAAIYRSPELQLFSRAADYSQMCESVWNRPGIPVIENFNIAEIVKHVRS